MQAAPFSGNKTKIKIMRAQICSSPFQAQVTLLARYTLRNKKTQQEAAADLGGFEKSSAAAENELGVNIDLSFPFMI